jgi:hypothetical protein
LSNLAFTDTLFFIHKNYFLFMPYGMVNKVPAYSKPEGDENESIA